MADQRQAAGPALGSCPVPTSRYDQVVLGHGSGGRLSADLIRQVFLAGYGNDVLAALEDIEGLDPTERRRLRREKYRVMGVLATV